MRHKPSFILFEKDESDGMNLLNRVLVEKKGFLLDTVRTLVVKYPYILGKPEEQLLNYFKTMNEFGLSDDEAMRFLLECPKLISIDLEEKSKEIFFIYNLYHKIN